MLNTADDNYVAEATKKLHDINIPQLARVLPSLLEPIFNEKSFSASGMCGTIINTLH